MSYRVSLVDGPLNGLLATMSKESFVWTAASSDEEGEYRVDEDGKTATWYPSEKAK